MRTIIVNQNTLTLLNAAGRTFGFGNEMPAMIGCVHVVLITTATVGNRTLVLRVQDASFNTLFEGQAPIVAASLTTRMNWGAGMVAITAGNYILNGLPDMSIPPLALLNIFDGANIDGNDTIQVNTSVADPR